MFVVEKRAYEEYIDNSDLLDPRKSEYIKELYSGCDGIYGYSDESDSNESYNKFYDQFSIIINNLSGWIDKNISQEEKASLKTKLNKFHKKYKDQHWKSSIGHYFMCKENLENICYLLSESPKTAAEKRTLFKNLIEQLNKCDGGVFNGIEHIISRLKPQQESVVCWLASTRKDIIEKISNNLTQKHYNHSQGMHIHVLNYCMNEAKELKYNPLGFEKIQGLGEEKVYIDDVRSYATEEEFKELFEKEYNETAIAYAIQQGLTDFLYREVDLVKKGSSEWKVEFYKDEGGRDAISFAELDKKKAQDGETYNNVLSNMADKVFEVLDLPDDMKDCPLSSDSLVKKIPRDLMFDISENGYIFKKRDAFFSKLTPYIQQYMLAQGILSSKNLHVIKLKKDEILFLNNFDIEKSWIKLNSEDKLKSVRDYLEQKEQIQDPLLIKFSEQIKLHSERKEVGIQGEHNLSGLESNYLFRFNSSMKTCSDKMSTKVMVNIIKMIRGVDNILNRRNIFSNVRLVFSSNWKVLKNLVLFIVFCIPKLVVDTLFEITNYMYDAARLETSRGSQALEQEVDEAIAKNSNEIKDLISEREKKEEPVKEPKEKHKSAGKPKLMGQSCLLFRRNGHKSTDGAPEQHETADLTL